MTKSSAPSFSFLTQHPAHLIACGFGSGLSPVAPGTAGTLFAWLTFPLVHSAFPDNLGFGIFLLLTFLLGMTACQIAGRALGEMDHGSIVWDEIVPFWAVLFLVPSGLLWQLAAFAAFRLFDIVKPPPASFFDRQVKNGFGVMMDDVVAAAYALLTLALAKALLDRLS
jgi:phosphatidylglycerophosphatase A